jgi:hypothetical protein
MADTRPMSLGRNHLCYCGSGIKYKRCHFDLDREAPRVLAQAWPEVHAKLAEHNARDQRLREEYGVDINYVSPIQFKGRKVWAIGSRLYTDRSPKETFHEFILHVLRQTFGEPWRAEQTALADDERHFVLKCFQELTRFKEAHTDHEALARDGQVSAVANGWVSYLMSLAWDVATLVHAADLPESMVKRLRDRDQFQGARYEIAIAATFARLDCEIRLLDDHEDLQSVKHVEFEATHRPTGQTFAVEAKSRHRAGVVNRPGEHDPDDPLRGDARGVRKLYRDAVLKAPEDKPFFIFIDINAPLSTDGEWQADVQGWMARLPEPSEAQPSSFNALLVTNFSPHYAGDDISTGGTWLGVLPSHVRNPIKARLVADLYRALDAYGRVPSFAEDGRLLP